MKSMISVVMPCYNREKNLRAFLENIRQQTYPKDSIEIVIADGGSTDNTVEVAREYGCRVIINKTNDLEKRRKIAVEESIGEYIFMVDDDNFFPNPNLLEDMLEALINEGASAAECVWQYYDKNDYAINRYCSLYGTYDPTTLYLKKNDHMSIISKKWSLLGNVIKETDRYFKVKLNRDEVLTMGGQGFLCRKEDMLKGVSGSVIMHMDIAARLINEGNNEFIFMKDYFGHNCVKNKKELLLKLKRNIIRYHNESSNRVMNYNMNIWEMIRLGLIMGTLIIPLCDAIKGYMKLHDSAWFIHPILCIQVVFCYTKSTVGNFCSRKGEKRKAKV